MRIIIADDHGIMVDGLLSLLSNHDDIAVVGIANNGLQALNLMDKEKNIDILLTDISMPEMNGIELTKAVKSKYPHIKVIALTMHGDITHINEMLEAGAAGYIYKNVSNAELIDALQKVFSGRQYFSNEIASTIMSSLHSHQKIKEMGTKVNLTQREREIIQLIAKEYSNAQISTELFISERTVETHRKNIYLKTKTSSIVGLIKWAYENKVA